MIRTPYRVKGYTYFSRVPVKDTLLSCAPDQARREEYRRQRLEKRSGLKWADLTTNCQRGILQINEQQAIQLTLPNVNECRHGNPATIRIGGRVIR